MSAAAGKGKPWYREFWPWALMVPPALSILGGLTMIVLALGTPSALVVDDYARIEELTAARFARDRLAADLGLEALVRLGIEPGRIELRLGAAPGFSAPPALVLRLKHATDPSADRELRLVRFGDAYRGEVDFAPGRYAIELVPEDESWRLGAGVARLAGEIELQAQAAGG